ncbi:MAG: hypothetical protein HYR63_14070 [Proteobacteria bacterium]|nr:hypothetical protein [Pseudomonadota bacterium]
MRGASLESAEPTAAGCGSNGANATVWYAVTAPAGSTSLTVSASYGGAKSASTTPAVTVYTGIGLGNLVPVKGVCSVQTNNAQADFSVPVTALAPYWIQLGQFYYAVDPAAQTTMTVRAQ